METMEGKCDMCLRKDKFHGHNLQQCKTCGVKVHETCYGLPSTQAKLPEFECAACESTENGKYERPTECQLCSVTDGIHAMHPVYDKDGPDGKPLMIAPKGRNKGGVAKPAWIHTLCGMFIASQNGFVYGCDQDGAFEGGDEEEDAEMTDSDDEEEEVKKPWQKNLTEKKAKRTLIPSSGSSATNAVVIDDSEYDSQAEIDDDKNDDDDDDDDEKSDSTEALPTHHFVFSQYENGKPTPWTIKINELRNNVKCILCGQSDKKGTFRIPVQCSYGDDEELEEFKKRHPPNEPNECYEGFHVGCARWGKNDFGETSPLKRVFFYPGQEEELEDDMFNEPISNAYCDRHARMIHRPKQRGNSGAQCMPVPSVSLSKERSAAASAARLARLKLADSEKAEQDRMRAARQKEVEIQRQKQQTQREARRLKLQMQKDQNEEDKRKQDQKNKDIENKKKELISNMNDDLMETIVALLLKNSDKRTIVAAKKSCRSRWQKESNFGLNLFKKLWSKVEDMVQESTQKEVETWKKNKAIAAAALKQENDTKANQVLAAAMAKQEKNSNVAYDTTSAGVSGDVSSSSIANKIEPEFEASIVEIEEQSEEETPEPTPWDHLWVPNYGGVGLTFDKWDTYESIDHV